MKKLLKNSSINKLISTAMPSRTTVVLASDNIETTFATKPDGWDVAKPYGTIPGPKAIPILGNIWRFFPVIGEFQKHDPGHLNQTLFKKFGKIVRLTGLPFPDTIMLYDPQDIQHLFRNEGVYPERVVTSKSFTHYRLHHQQDLYKGFTGVGEAQGKEWHDLRSKLNPILMQPQTILKYAEDMDTIANQLIQKMRYFSSIDTKHEMPEDFMMTLFAWILESITFVCLDKQLGCLNINLSKDSEPYKLTVAILEIFELFKIIEKPHTLRNIYKTKSWKRFVEAMDFATVTLLKHINEAMDQTYKSTSILQQMLKIDKTLALVTAIDLLVGGVETTGKTAGSALYLLAKKPDVQKRLREELVHLLPSKNSPVTKDVLSKATYLKAVIKETTRLSPAAIGTPRRTVKDMVLGGYQIPSGTNILASHFTISLLEENYKHALEFIPERWLRSSTGELSAKTTHPFVTLPFSFGPRSCIGKRLAMLELEVGIAKIIRNFYIEWNYKDAKFGATPFYGITDPLKIRISEVSQ